jgi:hypothetical protein
MASKCSSGRNSRTSLTSNRKLEMIKFTEEGMSKASQQPPTLSQDPPSAKRLRLAESSDDV